MAPVQFRGSKYLLIAIAVSATMACADARARDAVQRDVESYAIASCLVAQKEPYLHDQGDAWASAIIQRAKGELDALTAVAAAVKAELAKGNMAVIRNEAEPMKGKALPVMYCTEVIDAPSVRSAINTAIKKLEPAYRAKSQ
jgi:hypothetical protein